MGAKIEGAGTRRIIVEGVKELHGAEHDVIPDRIEAGTFLIAGAIIGKEVTIKRADPIHLKALLDPLAEAGFEVTTGKDYVTLKPGSHRRPLKIETLPYPGFPTD